MEVRSKIIICKCDRIKELDNIYSSQLHELTYGFANVVEGI